MSDRDGEYSDRFVAGLEWIWGTGFLSPGGSAEVAAILGGTNLAGKRVLDLGCGVGGVDVLLVHRHGADRVVGVDVDAGLIDRAREAAEQADLVDQLAFWVVKPGTLPFKSEAFDVAFSKDAIIHIPGKAAVFTDLFRILKPGGQLAVGDWFGSADPPTPELAEWLEAVHLDFAMGTIEGAASLLEDVGFVDVEYEDRNGWYAVEIERELEMLSGDNYRKLADAMGASFAEDRLRSSRLKQTVVNQGLLRPGHLRARKPDVVELSTDMPSEVAS